MTVAADTPRYTILVNTSDGFADCWRPFFELLSIYWPACRHPIVLNTELAEFSFPGLDIRCARVAEGMHRRLTWSECLMRCLDGIDTDLVLYLQEDYFLNGPVRTDVIDTFAAMMLDGSIDNIRLMECGGSGPWHPHGHPWLWRVDQRSMYRISMQAALWRRERLRAHLRRHESPWQLEVFGSRRAWRVRNEVLCANRDLFDAPERQIVPYYPTGIVKGQWERAAVVDLFARHGIDIDFSRRGFFDHAAAAAPRRPLTRRVVDRVRSIL